MNRRINIPSEIKHIRDVVNEVLFFLKGIRAEESDIFDIRLSLEETLINAIKYGNEFNKDLKVDVEFTHEDDKVIISVEDKGRGFDYHHLPDPTREENLLKGRGRGIFLVKHLMDNVEFNKKGNRITMSKYLKGKKSLSL